MKLLLTSQGIQKELKQEFINLLPKSPKDIKVVFITTAAYGDGEANPEWLHIYKKQLYDCGITQVEDLDLQGKMFVELEQIIKDKDIIFVNGGNTFYLLKYVKKSGFDKVLQSLLNTNKTYIGVSAGTYIACPTIEQATWKYQNRNHSGLTDLSALNFIPFLITAHFKEEHRLIIENASKKMEYPLVALYDTQAMLVENGKWKLIGKGKKEFFNGFKETLLL